MNNLYFFILGKNPTLSTAEIQSLININFINQGAKISELSNDFLLLETKEKLDPLILQERLGGIIKIGIIIDQANKFNSEIAIKILKNYRRPHFGFSFYTPANQKENHFSQIEKWAMEIKNQLKEENISSRWVTSREKILSSVIVIKNKLLTNGAEFVFLMGKEKSYFGQTLSCQQFEEYGRRDFGRPARIIEEGMLPPKIAKIMINLAELSVEKTLLDPFCGSGTVLQEAVVMNYKKIIGTDLSEEAIESTKKNLAWLKIEAKINVFQHDVRNLSEQIPLTSVDAIVTEPYLGPIKNKHLDPKQTIKELSPLYLKAFDEFKKILKPTGKVVIIFPVFKANYQLNFLPILDEIKKSGWQTINPIPQNLKNNNILNITARNSIIYSRPNQQVLREIFVFSQIQ
jgi:tRNA G10  N-methylase Trm11